MTMHGASPPNSAADHLVPQLLFASEFIVANVWAGSAVYVSDQDIRALIREVIGS